MKMNNQMLLLAVFGGVIIIINRFSLVWYNYATKEGWGCANLVSNIHDERLVSIEDEK
jgi:hypothetical protein